MTESAERPARARRRLPVMLFALTCVSTVFAGVHDYEGALRGEPAAWLTGLPYAVTLMAILVFHEAGHYVLSRWHRVRASLPYFIPMPLPPIGTMGAIIVTRSRIHHLRALFDIGAAGPLAGFVLAVPALFFGMTRSEAIAELPAGPTLMMGESLLVKLAIATVGPPIPEGGDVMLHPVAFAAWVGLFVTSLNLIPAGQLDGGHILYAFLGRRRLPFLDRIARRLDMTPTMALHMPERAHSPMSVVRRRVALKVHALAADLHRAVGLGIAIVLIAVGWFGWKGWVLWGCLLLLIGTRHESTQDDHTPLDPRRRAVGWACAVIFVLCFTPVPFQVTG